MPMMSGPKPLALSKWLGYRFAAVHWQYETEEEILFPFHKGRSAATGVDGRRYATIMFQILIGRFAAYEGNA